VALLIYLVYSSKKNSYRAFSLVFVLVIIMLFDHWLWSSHFGIFLFWLVVGLIAKENEIVRFSEDIIDS
jgi:hypothetical protein